MPYAAHGDELNRRADTGDELLADDGSHAVAVNAAAQMRMCEEVMWALPAGVTDTAVKGDGGAEAEEGASVDTNGTTTRAAACEAVGTAAVGGDATAAAAATGAP